MPFCKEAYAQYARERRLSMKERLISEFGGACEICGYSRCLDALVFHHRDPALKSFEVSKASMNRRWDAILAEAQKCALLCANCHAETHAILRTAAPHA